MLHLQQKKQLKLTHITRSWKGHQLSVYSVKILHDKIVGRSNFGPSH